MDQKFWKQPESQFDTKNNIIVMCNEDENELYRPRDQEKNKQKTFIEWLRK
jgi:hypothetical protein